METIGKYRIIDELGKGGFGHVYKAEDPAIGLVVAIKVLNVQDDEGMIRRFRAEAVMSARLRHRNIVTVFDFEESANMQYLVMEYLDGQNLLELIEGRSPIPVLDKLSIMAEVAEGLQYAHEQGVIHRDIKPANIMQLRDGSVKIMDFGIARLTQTSMKLTQTGYIVGTAAYMAPEQFALGGTDEQSDIWAYGVVLYEFLTGVNPFDAKSPAEVMYRVAHEEPPSVCGSVPGLPLRLDEVMRRLLEKNKEDRYRSLEDVRLDLLAVIQELGESQVSAMEQEAERLIRLGKYEEAMAVAARILKFDQKNVKARRWRAELRDLIRRQQEEKHIRALIEQADVKTTQLDFSAAEAILQDAQQIAPNHPVVRTRLEHIQAERQKRARAQSLLAEARTDFDRHALTSALEHASEAVEADPANADAASLLGQVQQAMEARDAEARRKAGLSKARGLLLVQDYAGAVAALQELAAQYPADPEVRTRLDEAVRLQTVDAAEKKAAAAIARSRDFLVKGAFQEAIDLLSSLDGEAGARNPQVQQLLNFAIEQRDQQKRDAEVEQLLAAALSLTGKGEHDKALNSLARALELSPGNEKAGRLRKTVLLNRQRDEENQAIEAELRGSKELMDAGRLDEARARAKELWNRHPEHAGVKQMIADLSQRIAQREKAKELEIESRKLEVELMLDRGQVGAALDVLQTLTNRFKTDAFTDLVRRARRLDNENRERDAVNAILARSQGLSEAGQWDEARLAVEQGLKQFPKSASLLGEKQRIQQQADLEAAVNEIRRKIGRHELDAAVMAAESGLRRFPAEPRLAELLEKARGEREWQDMLLRAENLVLADELDEAAKVMGELARRGRADATLTRLLRTLEKKQARRQKLASAGQLRKRSAFREAREVLQGMLRDDPADAAAQTLLDLVDRESTEHGRREKVAAARAEAERLAKTKDFAAALKVLSAIANEFPDDVDVQDDLRKARDSRDQSAQNEAYAAGCREFDALMRARQFDRAIAKAQELIAAFPEQADLRDDLRHATEAHERAERQAAYDSGRRELSALVGGRQYHQAIQKAEELIAAFPGETDLEDELRRLREERDRSSRSQACAEGRKEVDALLKERQFEPAIAKLEQLVLAFPEEPGLQDQLRRLREEREESARLDALARGRREFEGLMKAREFTRAVAKARELHGAFPQEPDLNEDLSRAVAARDEAERKQAYTQHRKELDELMRNQQFDQAVAKATALVAAFPDEPELPDELNRARQARDRAKRKEIYARNRRELDRLMKAGQYAQAAAYAEQLAGDFPEEPELQEILRRAREFRDQAARKEAYARGRKEFEELMRGRKFAEAVTAAERLIVAFPEEPELLEDLRRAREARDQAARKAAITRGRQDFEGLMRAGQFERAVAAAEQLIAAFPDEPELQEVLRRAREARDQAARKAAYDRARQEFESLMRNRQYDRAVAKAQELLAAFPAEPGAADDLKRAREAQEQAARKAAYDRGRKEFDALMRNRQFDQAVVKVQELMAAFPEESILPDDLKRAAGARDEAARRAEFERQRKGFEALMKAGRFDDAIQKAEGVAKDFPDDPLVQQDLQAARDAKRTRDRNNELNAHIAELEALLRKGQFDAVRKGAEALLREYDDPRIKEILRQATTTQQGLKAMQPAPGNGNRRLVLIGLPLAVVLAVVGVYEWLKPPPPGQIKVSPQELSFTYQLGSGAPAAQAFTVSGADGTKWSVKPSDPWFQASAAADSGKATVSVAVVMDRLREEGELTGYADLVSPDTSASMARVKIKLKVIPAPKASQSVASLATKAAPEPKPPAKSTQEKVPGLQTENKPPAKVENTPAMTPLPPEKQAVAPPPQPIPAPKALEPAVDCHAAMYPGLSSGSQRWPGVLEPGKSVIIERHNHTSDGARVTGESIPGCAITVVPIPNDGRIQVLPPSPEENFSKAVIKNISDQPVSGPGFQWKVK